MNQTRAATLLYLLGAHALADYPLQGPYLSAAKNHTRPLPGVHPLPALLAHAAVHGAAVALATRRPWLGWVELAAHAATDYLKCGGHLTFAQDQAVHALCKLAYVALAPAEESPARGA